MVVQWGGQACCRERARGVGRGLGKGRRPGFPEAAARLCPRAHASQASPQEEGSYEMRASPLRLL